METTYHLTGLYPKWWKGRRFDEPIVAYAASDTTESTRNILVKAYLGGLKESEWGTGTIPKSCLIPGKTTTYEVTRRQGTADAIDTLSVKHVSGGTSYLQFKSYDQGRSKFQGTAIKVIHLDEEPPWDVYEECRIRLTGTDSKRGGTMILTMTPLMGTTETVMRFTMDRDPEVVKDGRVYVQASWRDVDHLSEEEILRLEDAIPAHMLEARSKGIPSIGEGKVYPISESQILVPRFEIPEHFLRVFGIDFGWTDPTAVVFGTIDPDTDIMFIYAEYKVGELTPQNHAMNIYNMGGDWIPGVADPYGGVQSGKADGVAMIDRYIQAGVDVIPAARNFVLNGTTEVMEQMLAGKLKIFNDLGLWLGEFRMYGYDKQGKPADRNNHLMDATRYLVCSGREIARAKRNRTFFGQMTQKLNPWAV